MIESRRRLRIITRATAAAAVLALILTLGYYAAPAFLARDVLREVAAHPVTWRRLPDGGAQVDELVLEKVPPPCLFVSWRWMAGQGGALRPVDVTRPGYTPGPSRPAGLQSFGPIRIAQALPIGPAQVRAVWWYKCGDDLTETPVELGPWVIP